MYNGLKYIEIGPFVLIHFSNELRYGLFSNRRTVSKRERVHMHMLREATEFLCRNNVISRIQDIGIRK